MDQIPKNPIAFFFYASRAHRAWMISALLCVTIGSFLSTYLVVVLKNLSDAIIAPNPDSSQIIFFGFAYPAIYLFAEMFWRGSGFSGMRLFTQTKYTAYQILYRYLSRHSRAYFNDKFAGSLLSNLSNIVDGSQRVSERSLWTYLPRIFGIIWFFIFSFISDWRLGVIMLTWSTVFIGLNIFFVKKLQVTSFAESRLRSVFTGRVVDSLSNISLVHEHGWLQEESGYLSKHTKAFTDAGLKNWQRVEWVLLTNNVLSVILISVMVGTAIYLFLTGRVSVGVVVMTISIVSQTAEALFFIGAEMVNTVKDYAQAEEGLEVILVPHGITDATTASELVATKGEIEFKNVSFAYGKNDIFTNFSLTIKPGQKVGLVGRSGAGKSTIVSLILRHFDPQKGEIRIDNQNIKEVERRTLQRAIAYVPQDTSLFHRTIFENIAYGSENATQAEVETAAKHALAHDFIVKLSKGYDTLVGERGIKLSGGQRQRIAIARMFMKQAKIVIFDEATSSLDSESEQAIKVAVHNLMEGKTVIAIAHRLSTIREMDRILYIEHGKIVEDGAPDMLLAKTDGYFKRLWEHQVSGFIKEDDE